MAARPRSSVELDDSLPKGLSQVIKLACQLEILHYSSQAAMLLILCEIDHSTKPELMRKYFLHTPLVNSALSKTPEQRVQIIGQCQAYMSDGFRKLRSMEFDFEDTKKAITRIVELFPKFIFHHLPDRHVATVGNAIRSNFEVGKASDEDLFCHFFALAYWEIFKQGNLHTAISRGIPSFPTDQLPNCFRSIDVSVVYKEILCAAMRRKLAPTIAEINRWVPIKRKQGLVQDMSLPSIVNFDPNDEHFHILKDVLTTLSGSKLDFFLGQVTPELRLAIQTVATSHTLQNCDKIAFISYVQGVLSRIDKAERDWAERLSARPQ